MNRNNSIFEFITQVDAKIEPFFSKTLPPLPDSLQELLAKITPYFTILGVVLSVFGLLAALGFTTIVGPFLTVFGGFYGAQAVTSGIIAIVFLALNIIINGIAIPALLKRQRYGWNLLFLSSLLGALNNLLSFNLVGLIIGFLISFYLLYQIKSYYRN